MNPTPSTSSRAGAAPVLVPFAGATAATRARLARALRGCGERERLALALLLHERLTPGEAAAALGLRPAEVQAAYRAALAELRRALRGRRAARPSRALARRAAAAAARRAA